MRMPRRARFLVLLVGAGVTLGAIGGVTYGAFFSTTSNSDTFSAAADFVAPTASASVVAKQTGYLAGYVKQGGAYFVYANATDTGNPASGVSTITANLSNITTGATSVALTSTGGPFSAQGVSYTYRSALQTASNPLAAGGKTYTLTLTDVAGNSQTQSGFSATADNTAPTASDVQIVNGTGTAGTPDNNDVITLTYSEQIDPQSVLAGWTGTALTVTVRATNGGGGNDTVTIWNSANTTQLNLGSINLGRTDYITVSRTFTTSSLTVSGGVMTIVMNGGAAGAGAGGTGTLVWTPSASAYDAAGNVCSAAAANESGAADMDF